jgi:hypothetical protein
MPEKKPRRRLAGEACFLREMREMAEIPRALYAREKKVSVLLKSIFWTL